MKFSDIKMWILTNLLSQLTSIINITCGCGTQVLKHVLVPTPWKSFGSFWKACFTKETFIKIHGGGFPLKIFVQGLIFERLWKYQFFSTKTFVMSAFIYYTNSVTNNDDLKKNCTSTLSWTLFCQFNMHNFKWTFLAQIFLHFCSFFPSVLKPK